MEEFKKSLLENDQKKVEEFITKYGVNTFHNELGCEYIADIDSSPLNFGGDIENNSYYGWTFFNQEHGRVEYVKDEYETLGGYIPWTPLQFCSAWNKVEMVQFLLKKGADANLKDATGRTAYDIARIFINRKEKIYGFFPTN